MDFDIKYEKFFLSNGIKCLLYKRKEIHSVRFLCDIKIGSLDENDKNNGLSHFIEHLTFNGSERFPEWSDLDNFINSISGIGNAYTAIDHTCYHGTFPFQYLDEVFQYYSQLILYPKFKQSDIEKEKIIILDEIKNSTDSIESKIYDNIRLNRYTSNNTPYSYRVIGSDENVSSFSRNDVLEHYEKYYIPDNITIYIVGNFNTSNVKRLLEKYFNNDLKGRKFQTKSEKLYYKKYPEYSNFNINSLQKKDIDQYYLDITFPAIEQGFSTFKERTALAFALKCLASSSFQQSILWEKLREELGLVYGVYSGWENFLMRAYSYIETSFKPEFLETILTEIYKGVEKLKKGEFDEKKFNSIIKKSLDLKYVSIDDPNGGITWMELHEKELELTGKGISFKESYDIISKLKFDDIVKIFEKVFDWEKVNIGLVTSDDPEDVNNKVKKIWESLK